MSNANPSQTAPSGEDRTTSSFPASFAVVTVSSLDSCSRRGVTVSSPGLALTGFLIFLDGAGLYQLLLL